MIGSMIHLRLVAPVERSDATIAYLEGTPSVINLVRLPGAAQKPSGDLILCDVAREDATRVLTELRSLRLHHEGTIAVEYVDTAISDAAREAERARKERLFVDDSANREALSRLGLFFDRARETSVLEGDLTDKINALLAEEAPDMSLKSMKTILQASEEDYPILFATAVDLLTTAMSRPGTVLPNFENS